MTEHSIRSVSQPNCPLCGAAGRMLYADLRDRSFAAPGQWGFRRCPENACGLVWLDPQPLPEDIGLAYAGYYTHAQPEPGAAPLRDICWAIWRAYLGKRFGYRQGVGPAWRKWLAPLARLHPGGRDELDAAAMYLPAPGGPARVLDVGCGSGVALARMRELGWQVQGVEVDPGGVEAARARGVPVCSGRLEDQQFPEASFDAVHSAHVLEHVHDPSGLVRECSRVLKPGGLLVLLTPNPDSWGHGLFRSAWLNLDPPRHLFLFTAANLRRLAGDAGLEVTALRSTPRSAWVYGALSRCIRRTGRGEMASLGQPANLAYGMFYQMRQRLVLRRQALAGDEWLLMARKPWPPE